MTQITQLSNFAGFVGFSDAYLTYGNLGVLDSFIIEDPNDPGDLESIKLSPKLFRDPGFLCLMANTLPPASEENIRAGTVDEFKPSQAAETILQKLDHLSAEQKQLLALDDQLIDPTDSEINNNILTDHLEWTSAADDLFEIFLDHPDSDWNRNDAFEDMRKGWNFFYDTVEPVSNRSVIPDQILYCYENGKTLVYDVNSQECRIGHKSSPDAVGRHLTREEMVNFQTKLLNVLNQAQRKAQLEARYDCTWVTPFLHGTSNLDLPQIHFLKRFAREMLNNWEVVMAPKCEILTSESIEESDAEQDNDDVTATDFTIRVSRGDTMLFARFNSESEKLILTYSKPALSLDGDDLYDLTHHQALDEVDLEDWMEAIREELKLLDVEIKAMPEETEVKQIHFSVLEKLLYELPQLYSHLTPVQLVHA